VAQGGGDPFGANPQYDPYRQPGTPPNPYASPYQTGGPVSRGSSGAAIAALVIGLTGLVLWLCPLLGLGAGIVAVVFGVVGRKSPSRGMAIAGIVLGVIAILLSIGNGVLGAILAISGQHPMFQQ
jgi:hypothetical protein